MERWLPGMWCALGLSVPLSFKLFLPGIGMEIIFPAEPLLAALAISMVIKSIRNERVITQLWQDPAQRLGIAWLVILVLTSLFSRVPLASFKVVVVQATYVGVFLILPLLAKQEAGLANALRWHDRAFLLVVVWTLITQSIHGFDRAGSNHAAYPFYADHTIYSAALTFVLFRQLVHALEVQARSRDRSRVVFEWMVLCFLLAALVVSFARGAWLAVLSTALLVLILRSRKSWLTGALIAIPIGLSIIAARGPILEWMSKQTVASQEQGTGVLETARSVVNLRNDTSNKDRVIRWKIAWRMFMDRPLSGHGPGSYQAIGQDFLLSAERSTLHANWSVPLERQQPAYSIADALWLRDHAQRSPSSGGTAHSEYLLSLSGSGIPGGLWWSVLLALCAVSIRRMIGQDRNLLAWGTQHAAALGLVAYLVHALFNNFLDDCKVALLFWPALALVMQARDR